MASQQVNAGPVPPAQVVGNAFVHQYYNILHQSPELVYRFYQETSRLGRPEENGVMSSITTMQAINDKILSLDYGNSRAEIKTVDAQESFNLGVLVLVTGYLTGKDNVRRNFTQSFFLAPQDKGYFVLNDVFRYVEENGQLEGNPGLVNPDMESTMRTPPEQVEVQKVSDEATHLSEEDINAEEVYNPSDDEDGSVVEGEAPIDEVINEVRIESPATVDAVSSVQEEVPKKSYASIVKVMKESPSHLSVPVPSARATPSNSERQVIAPAPPAVAQEAHAPNTNPTESSTQEAEGDGHSIYIKSLPLNATAAQLEEEFKKFGAIKSGGIQVRSNKQQGFCFGFVEFESSSSVQSAIEASPIMIGGRQAFVEEKRPSGSRASRGRFPLGRGGFRNEGPRGRGGYGGGGRGYSRGGDFNSNGPRTEYGGGRGGRAGGYQRVENNMGNGGGGGGGGRSNRPNPNAGGGLGSNPSAKSVAPKVPATA
ncbi:ras GTPase-activating protein-binding protein 1 [Amborella trichopoda]|uniref:NTF2 domain-containing protein n=2 Tax=Magnoliopsida TaxID=3398 RepID=W1PS35_AMBTC|nr:ras GTPase-activating protein-binding protein 1 [Amborella trichopoda]ERN10065.1 hypothetical protein AMTR_s00013p00254870 [Amborella trichopoda]|eukprot:XP_006848484.1 ras GTPase-activating protein-binding protein 1 [Amborella trichopoda]